MHSRTGHLDIRKTLHLELEGGKQAIPVQVVCTQTWTCTVDFIQGVHESFWRVLEFWPT